MSATLEFDRFIGLNVLRNGAILHPNGKSYIYSSGGNVVICDIDDTHNQSFLREHDDFITCIALSTSGKFLATGQTGISNGSFLNIKMHLLLHY